MRIEKVLQEVQKGKALQEMPRLIRLYFVGKPLFLHLRPMEIRYQFHADIPLEPLLTSLLDLLTSVFKNQSSSELRSELTYQQSRSGLLTHLAVVNGQVVGCKLGYERKPGHLYSWLGAVHPDFRGQGIASELMRQQHDWCRQQNYHTIRTQTYNQWRAMLILNLRFGFDIIGTVQGRHGLTLVMEKNLL